MAYLKFCTYDSITHSFEVTFAALKREKKERAFLIETEIGEMHKKKQIKFYDSDKNEKFII